jgi:hypothetical protein
MKNMIRSIVILPWLGLLSCHEADQPRVDFPVEIEGFSSQLMIADKTELDLKFKIIPKTDWLK